MYPWESTPEMGPDPSPKAVAPVWYAGSDGVLGELWTMLHVPYTLMVLSFVLVGAALAPKISWLLLAGTLLAYFLGLGIGAHFLDQIPGMGSRYAQHWPARALWFGGFLSLGVAVAIGVVGAIWFVGLPLLLFVGVQAMCAVGYPLARWFGGALHRDSVFAVSWGSLPFLTSYYAQAGTIDLVAILTAIAFGAVAVLEIRLSRASRRLRAQTRSNLLSSSTRSVNQIQLFRKFDRALQIQSLLTILATLGLFAGRVVLSIW
jgi:hypothetical protein